MTRYNTPPCSAIYAAGLVFKWAIQEGGVSALEAMSKHKAKLVYDALEQHPETFKILVEPQFRSRTNIVFRTVEGEAGDKRFVSEAEKEGSWGFVGCRVEDRERFREIVCFTNLVLFVF